MLPAPKREPINVRGCLSEAACSSITRVRLPNRSRFSTLIGLLFSQSGAYSVILVNKIYVAGDTTRPATGVIATCFIADVMGYGDHLQTLGMRTLGTYTW